MDIEMDACEATEKLTWAFILSFFYYSGFKVTRLSKLQAETIIEGWKRVNTIHLWTDLNLV